MDKDNNNTFNSKPVQEYLTKLKKWQQDINKIDQQLSNKNATTASSMIGSKPATTSSTASSLSPSSSDPMFDNVSESLKYKDIGNKFFQQQKYKDAVEYYTLAIDLDPSSSILFSNRAIAYIKLKNFHQAEADCNRSINLDSTNVKAYHRRGLALKEQKRYRESLNDFIVVSKKDPANKEAQTEIKGLYELIKRQPPQPQQQESEKTPIQPTQLVQPVESVQPKIQIKQDVNNKMEIEPTTTTTQQQIKQDVNNKTDKKIEPQQQQPKIELVSDTTTSKSSTTTTISIDSTTKKPTTPSSTSSTSSLQDRLSRLANMKPVVPKQPPRNSFEFEKVYNSLQNDSQLFYEYFKLIDPARLSPLLNDVLSPTLMTSIINILEHHYLVNKEYQLIYNGSKVYPPLEYSHPSAS
ncbi:hypothetical protein DFA_04946 [Cavenderia fasciculata]|uniref:RNA polymerase II-associated protein 3 n=1 Tax=Cavenderia fasciculata TaxID=261658 RepID=F4PML9_CACFS|nr:uncharacterized protein DFA_04946 [Cavenderia fasciculata]EGG22816.1 hypothetical protein DFA_04946 [Cavenderia fasciculata]|eukprot:XP_004360667.1 hypothetical protein DFA_04946 [Cavenderia fasciculata]